MTMDIEWHPDALQVVIQHAKKGISEAKQAGRSVETLKIGAQGGWTDFAQVSNGLTQGASLRFFQTGELTVIVQVMPPVKLRVAAVGVSVHPSQFPALVAQAVSVI